MKKAIYPILSVLSFLSCNRAELKPALEGNCFQAGIESTDGKSFLSRNAVLWSSGDEIAVFTSGTMDRFTLSEGASTATGVFTGPLVEADEYYALYPYSETARLGGQTIATEIPQYQKGRLNSVGDGQNVMVAHSTSHSLSFKNVSPILKFEILSSNIGEVVITGNNGEILAGKVEISLPDGTPVCNCTEGRASVVLQSGDKPFIPGCYYAAVLPNTFTKASRSR